MPEGNAGTVSTALTVALSAPSGRTVSVDYTTANSTATTPADYAVATGTLEFAPGETSKPVPLQVNGDVLDEADEVFHVNLTPTNATSPDPQGAVTITDDDALPSLSIDDVTVPAEGNTATVSAVFTVTLSPSSGRSVTVDYATVADSAVSPADYTHTAGQLTFTAGQTTRQVTVPVKGDTIDESNERFFLDLTLPAAPAAAIADGRGAATITDDDGTPQVSIANATASEGAGTLNLNVTLNAPSGLPVTVDYSTTSEPDGTATDADYAPTTGTITFAPGDMSEPMPVTLKRTRSTSRARRSRRAQQRRQLDDLGYAGTAVGTITDDDDPPTISIDDIPHPEGNAGKATATFSVSLSGPGAKTVTVDYETDDGTATAPADYDRIQPTTLTFAPGETTKPLPVLVAGDTLDEIDETFTVDLLTSVDGLIAPGQLGEGQGTINDDDAPPTLSINDVSVAEGNVGHDGRDVHGHPDSREWANRHRRLRDCKRHRCRTL